ncbi:MAG: PqiC family protein [Candidatus Omnitrophota bacterium]
MRETGIKYCVVAMLLAFALVSGGCMSIPNSPTPRFYALRPIDKGEAGTKFNIAPDIIIGVGPVRIPEYMNRPQIVTQDKNRMLKFSEFDRWGEPLDLALTRLVGTNLTAIITGGNIEIYPWNLSIPVKYQVVADIVQLESELDKDLFIAIQWSIFDVQNTKMLFTKRLELSRPINPHNYAGMVQALSDACVSLSSEIAREVAILAAQPKPKTEAAAPQG